MKSQYILGKCDYNNSGRKNCKAVITWELSDGNFSMCADIWNPRETDIYTGGQCVDQVAAHFPGDQKAQRMVAIWREWHLNDMQAGSLAQTKWLKENLSETDYAYPNNYYTVACEKLAAVGLNPDPGYIHEGKPYAYGSAWLKEELPPEVVAEIKSWG